MVTVLSCRLVCYLAGFLHQAGRFPSKAKCALHCTSVLIRVQGALVHLPKLQGSLQQNLKAPQPDMLPAAPQASKCGLGGIKCTCLGCQVLLWWGCTTERLTPSQQLPFSADACRAACRGVLKSNASQHV